MSTTGVAPAKLPSQAVIGPATTQVGFKYWFLVASPDYLIAVRQGPWAVFSLSMAVTGPAMFGLLGAIFLGSFFLAHAKNRKERIGATLLNTPMAHLRTKRNVIYQVSQIKSITCVRTKAIGGIVLPEITIETKAGRKQKYGLFADGFDEAYEKLKQMYPTLCEHSGGPGFLDLV